MHSDWNHANDKASLNAVCSFHGPILVSFLDKVDPSQPIKSWRTAWRRALKDASLDIRFHDLRHTCITKLAEGRASEQTLMAIAGHLSRKMLEHYSHIRMAAKRTAVDALVLPVIDGGVAQNGAQSEGVQIGTA